MKESIDNKSLPTILYLPGEENDEVSLALEAYFSGRYRVVVSQFSDCDFDTVMPVINEVVAKEQPTLIIGTGIYGDYAIACDRDEDTDILAVNPTMHNALEEIPMWKFNNVFALCSICDKAYVETAISKIESEFSQIRLFETNAFDKDIDKDGVKYICRLIDRIDRYKKLSANLMSAEEFDDMVRNRPAPDTPSYYSLKVWTYDNDEYSRETVEGQITYRCPLSSRQAEFPTKEEAEEAMRNVIKSTEDEIFMIQLDRLPFGRFDKKPFWLEAWTYDAEGKIIQESTCSGSHFHERGIYGKYFGHLPERFRWKEGQIVGIVHKYFRDYKEYATLGVVAETPKTTAEGYEDYVSSIKQWIRKGCDPENWLEMTDYAGSDDDEMFIQYGPYTEDWINFTFHNPLSVVPAPADLPKNVIAELQSWHNDWLRHLEEEHEEEIRVIDQMCEKLKKDGK